MGCCSSSRIPVDPNSLNGTTHMCSFLTRFLHHQFLCSSHQSFLLVPASLLFYLGYSFSTSQLASSFSFHLWCHFLCVWFDVPYAFWYPSLITIQEPYHIKLLVSPFNKALIDEWITFILDSPTLASIIIRGFFPCSGRSLGFFSSF